MRDETANESTPNLRSLPFAVSSPFLPLFKQSPDLRFIDPKRSFSAIDREQSFARQNGLCRFCSQPISLSDIGHHIILHSKGGPTTAENCMIVHDICHERLPPQVSRVAFPAPELLQEIAGHNIAGAAIGHLALGEYIYAKGSRYAKKEEWMYTFHQPSMYLTNTSHFKEAGFHVHLGTIYTPEK